MKSDMLSTFRLVNRDRVVSPILTTIRMYAKWLENIYDEYTVQEELYLHATKKDGTRVLEWHPGTKIGHWFDVKEPKGNEYRSWYILQDSPMMDRLVYLKQAEYKDSIPISVNDEEGRRMLRVYTVNQIELYIRSNMDKNFSINRYIGESKQVRVKDSDMDKLIIPQIKSSRGKLF